MKKVILITCAAIMWFSTSANVMAADGAALYKTKSCVACHGKDGKKGMLETYPSINGQSAAYAIQQMKDIKSGARNNADSAAMKGVMNMVNDEEIKAIAEWLETIK
ncbi:MAG TPA: cytochrome c [Chromatiales bacterium]|nr:cytochrome c [Thiotrichales bacterium]HIP67064.1 cytochrome c [Chromatiales bacterium]